VFLEHGLDPDKFRFVRKLSLHPRDDSFFYLAILAATLPFLEELTLEIYEIEDKGVCFGMSCGILR
jgi:hypothetical protein